jgi:hypothetical protein
MSQLHLWLICRPGGRNHQNTCISIRNQMRHALC